jgi:uncharacterized protein
MRIGVIADTHIPDRAPELPAEIHELFKGVDRIVHAGDIEDQRVLDELEAIAPVIAVGGNMDVRLRQLPYKRELRLADHYLGVIHGGGVPRNRIREAIRREFKQASIIVYGHTHQAFWGEEGGIWFMNPGSPTDTVSARYRSVGMLELSAGTPRGEIIRL